MHQSPCVGALQNSSLAVTFLIPSNDAFETAASELNITSQDFLGLPELRRILELHALIKPLEVSYLLTAGLLLIGG